MPRRPNGIGLTANQELTLVEKAMSGDILFSILPATTGTAATTEDFTRTVSIKAVTAAGEIHTWLNQAYTTTLSIAEVTAGDGTASIVSTTLTLVNGQADIVVSGTGTWAEADTNTLTVGNITVMGYTVTGGTSVDTITA